MRMLMENVLDATEVLSEIDEAMIPFSPDEIPEFNRKWQYTVKTEWFCRKMLRLLFTYNVGSENEHAGGNRAIGEAFFRLICLGLDTGGYGQGVVEFLSLKDIEKKMQEEGMSKAEIIQGMNNQVEKFKKFFKMTNDAAETYTQYNEVVKEIKKDPNVAVKLISLLSLLLFMEFDFCHEYPGADQGVEKGAFQSIAYLCAIAMNLKEDDLIGLLDFLNSSNKRLDIERHIRRGTQ